MVRDRLQEMKTTAQSMGNFVDDAIYVIVEKKGKFLDDFFAEVQVVTEHIEKIELKVNEVKKMHSAILSSPQQDEKTKKQLESMMSDIKECVDKVRKQLRLMEDDLKQEHNNFKDTAEYRIREIQHAALSHKFIEAMIDYNNAQADYRQRCKDRIQRQLEITGRKVTNDEIEDMLETGSPSVFVQGIVVETQRAKQSLADIEARHNDIIKLEKSIRDLHDMFTDMAMLVETQGELIDRVEYNVHRAKEYTDESKKNITIASKLQTKARKKKIILLLIALVVVIIIVLAVVLWT